MKRLLKVLLAVALILILAVATMPLWVDALARAAVESGGERALGVETRVDDVDLSVFGGTCSLRGLVVHNPEGFPSPHFVRLETGDVAVDARSLLSDRVEVPRLLLEGVDVHLDRNEKGSNYGIVLERIGGDGREGGRAFVVREVVIRDVKVTAQVSLTGLVKQDVVMRLREIRFRNVGEEGIPLPDIYALVLRGLMGGIVETGAKMLPKEIVGGLRGALSVAGGAAGLGLEVVGTGGEVIFSGGKLVLEGVGGVLDGILGGGDAEEKTEEKKD